jgi:hypothetical protein
LFLAESSITLSDVDTVLCLGTHKALQYHPGTHRVHLVNTWISKASATQRAGRTGRVRPGKVYRLYSKKLYDTFGEHEQSEIHRKPLQDVILSLRSMMEDTPDFEGVVPILDDLLEPPDIQNVVNSFEFLHSSNMITDPNDSGNLTSIGRLASQLPVDLQLGRLISYGINLGVGTESIIIASALSQPKTLFRIASPLVHTDPDELNEIIRTTLLGAVELDDKMYSEPMLHIRLFADWSQLTSLQSQYNYAKEYGLAHTRVKLFVSSTIHLIARVKESLAESTASTISLDNISSPNIYKQNMLRLILAWNNEDNILQAKDLNVKSDTAFYTAIIESPNLSLNHLKPLFPRNMPWKLDSNVKKIYDGRFSDTSRTPLQLLTALISAADTIITWLIHQSVIGDKKLLNITFIIAIATEESNPDRDHDQQEELVAFRKAFHINFPHIEKAGVIEGSSKHGDVYDIFLLSNPSKREMKWWNEVHDELSKSVSMLIPVEGHAKIRDNNCNLTMSQLQNLFFGHSINVKASEDESEESLKKKYHIAEQIISSKQVLIFPNPLEKNENTKNHGKKPAFPSDLIIDIPIGLRLINAYRNIYKDKKMRLWSNPRNITESKSSTLLLNGKSNTSSLNSLVPSQISRSNMAVGKPAAIVPGSSEWGKKRLDSQTSLKEMAGEVDNYDDDDDDENKIIVNIKAISTNWVNVTSFGRLADFSRPPQALLSRQSAISVAVHCGPGVLHAVAYNSISIGQDSRLVFMEGVTVLPPGTRWLILALRCMGKNVTNSDDSNEEKKVKEMTKSKNTDVKDENYPDRPLSEIDIDKCSRVYELLQRLSRGPVCRAPGVISVLEDIFKEWIGDSSKDEPQKKKSIFQPQQILASKENNSSKVSSSKNEVPKLPIKQALNDNKKPSSSNKLGKDQSSKSKAKETQVDTSQNTKSKTKSQEGLKENQKFTKKKSPKTSESPKYDCSYCQMKFSSPIYLYRHINITHKNETVSATSSPRNRTSLLSNNTSSKTIVKSEVITKQLSTPKKETEFQDTEESKFVCERCNNKSFTSQIGLMHHNQSVHRKGSQSSNTTPSSDLKQSQVITANTAITPVVLPPGSKVTTYPPNRHIDSLNQDLNLIINLTSKKSDAAKLDSTPLVSSKSTGVMKPPPPPLSAPSSSPSQSSKNDIKLICSLYNSITGCQNLNCSHEHIHPAPDSEEWKLLKRQFKNLTRRSNYTDLKPLPSLKFDFSKN